MDKQGGITVHFYCDVDTDPSTSQFQIKDYGEVFKAEELIQMGCKKKEIGPSAFYLFGLLENSDLNYWLPPNREIVCSNEKARSFYLRIRFIPSIDGIRIVGKDCKPALDYFFLQCRTDFVKDKIRFPKGIGQEHILGLGVVDMLRWGKEKQMDINLLKKEEPKKFIPSSSKKLFKLPWDSKRLSLNFNSELDKLHNQDTDVSVTEHKLRYLYGFLKYADSYGIENFLVDDGNFVIVNPRIKDYSSIYVVNQKGNAENICEISEVQYIDLDKTSINQYRVIISRNNGIPKTMFFQDENSTFSFISLVDGYYRLIEDFHYHVCSQVYSPLLIDLAKWKCHGPVKKQWAENRLMQKHMNHKDFNYLMKQRSNDFNCYTLLYIVNHPQPELKTLGIVKNSSDKWQFNFSNPVVFDTIEKLLSYYRKNNDPNISLNRYVPPAAPLDNTIYLCRELLKNENKENTQNQNMNSQVTLIGGINQRQADQEIVKGHYTSVRRHLWNKNTNELQKVAVKTLRSEYSPQYLEEFMEGMHRLTFWKCPTIIAIHAVCLSPFQVVLEDCAAGNLESFLYSEPIADVELVSVADQIAQALFHIHARLNEDVGVNYGYHGNVRSRNVFVFPRDAHSKNDTIRVKLGDPGMISLYNKLPLDHPINEERLPWIAPELYSPKVNLRANNQCSDVYSYGVFLWEVYSGGQRPLKALNIRQIFRKVLFEEGLVPPEDCSAIAADLVRSCLRVDAEKRPNAKEIVRDLGKLISESSPHSYDHANIYDAEERSDVLDENEQNAAIDKILNSSGVQNIDNDNSQMFVSATMSTDSVPESPQTPQSPESVNTSFGTWDSRTPLVPPASGGSFISMPSYNQQSSVDTSASGVSRDTMLTMLTEGESMSDDMLIDNAIQKRPLPPEPKVPVEELSYILSHKRLEIFDKSVLGQGHYGKVYKGSYKLSSGVKQTVAVKCLKPDMCDKHHEHFREEFKVMTSCEHPHIVDVIGMCEKGPREMFLVMEFVDNGCLRDYLTQIKKKVEKKTDAGGRSQKSIFREKLPDLHRFSYEVAQGMIYLNSQKIVHRDLAARNVLVTTDHHMKISDFGLARVLGNEKDYYSMSDKAAEIPIYWCAPESIDKRKFSTKSDVWSYGVTMWEIYNFGDAPRLCKTESLFYVLETLQKRLPPPSICPVDIYEDIMKKCWAFKDDDRLTFEEIVMKLEKFQTR